MSERAAGFCVIERWRIKREREAAFRAAWQNVTERRLRDAGSLGARLHQADDGTWIAYGQWPSRAAWEASVTVALDPADTSRLDGATLERFEPLLLDVESDRLGTVGWTLQRIAASARTARQEAIVRAMHTAEETALCPRCRYVMRGAEETECSECGYAFGSVAAKRARAYALAVRGNIVGLAFGGLLRAHVALSLLVVLITLVAYLKLSPMVFDPAPRAGAQGAAVLRVQDAIITFSMTYSAAAALSLLAARGMLLMVSQATRNRLLAGASNWLHAATASTVVALAIGTPLIVLVVF